MNVVAFPRKRSSRNAALASIYKAQAALRDAGYRLAMEVGCSDEGDPWASFLSEGETDVIAHLAFIDGEFVADSDAFSRPLRSREIGPLISQLLRSLRCKDLRYGTAGDFQMLVLVAAVALAASHLTEPKTADLLPVSFASAVQIAEQLTSPKIAAVLLAAAYPEEHIAMARHLPVEEGYLRVEQQHAAASSGTSVLASLPDQDVTRPLVADRADQPSTVEPPSSSPWMAARGPEAPLQPNQESGNVVSDGALPAHGREMPQAELAQPSSTTAPALHFGSTDELIAFLDTHEFTIALHEMGNATLYVPGYSGEQLLTFEDHSTIRLIGVQDTAVHQPW